MRDDPLGSGVGSDGVAGTGDDHKVMLIVLTVLLLVQFKLREQTTV